MNRKALSLVEIMIVATILSLMFTILVTITSSSTRQHGKTMNMIESQALVEVIITRIREDARMNTLVQEITNNRLTLASRSTDSQVTYFFDEAERKITRETSTGKRFQVNDFSSAGKIAFASFSYEGNAASASPWAPNLTIVLNVLTGKGIDNQSDSCSVISMCYFSESHAKFSKGTTL